MNISWPVLLLICGVLIVIALVLVMPIPRFRIKARMRADRGPISTASRDDDRYWYGGFLYNNPDDPEVLIPKRNGLGWTLNFGHPAGKGFLIGLLLVGLVLPLALTILGHLVPGFLQPTGCHPSGCSPWP